MVYVKEGGGGISGGDTGGNKKKMKKRCDNIFESITEVGDVRKDFYWSGNSDCQRSKENYNIISILSILDEYSSSTQISLNELLEIILSNDNLFDYQRASAIYQPKDIVFYSMVCHRCFIPSCSDSLTVSII